jgi:hypothetical protein
LLYIYVEEIKEKGTYNAIHRATILVNII